MGISITELIIIFVVLLVLFGPEQLPVIARQFGKIMGDLKRGSDAVRREFYNSVYTPAQEVKRGVLGEELNLRTLKAQIMSPPSGSSPSPDLRRSASSQPAATEKTESGDSSTASLSPTDPETSKDPQP